MDRGERALPEGASALPDPVRLWPYQREIADAIGNPAIERVTLVKPVRVGFTTLLTGAMASFVANEPAPIRALLPTESCAPPKWRVGPLGKRSLRSAKTGVPVGGVHSGRYVGR